MTTPVHVMKPYLPPSFCIALSYYLLLQIFPIKSDVQIEEHCPKTEKEIHPHFSDEKDEHLDSEKAIYFGFTDQHFSTCHLSPEL